MKKHQWKMSMGLLPVWVGAIAAVSVVASAAGGYAGHPQAEALIGEMVERHSFRGSELRELFAGARRLDSVLQAISRPAEKTKPWHEYRQIFVTDTRTEQGLEFYRGNAETLRRAEREFGVPAPVIVAIIGVETRYGRNKGSYPVLDALATLAFDYPPRSPFFTKELQQYLLMTREQGLAPTALKGSYAGAMGLGQFIPSSYRNYAVDYDGDGVVDILDNPTDAIGSVANYLARHGWARGAPVAALARVAAGACQDWFNDGLKPQRPLRTLAAAGIHPAVPAADHRNSTDADHTSNPGHNSASAHAHNEAHNDAYDPDALVTAMRLEGESGPEHWVGWHNFYVITRYNHSAMYALAVYQLSQRIAEAVR